MQAPQGVQQSVPPFSSLRRCGCPVDTSARQKHRPSRQARCVNGCGNPFFLFRVLRILSRSALRMTDIQLLQAPQGVQQSVPPFSSLRRCGCPVDTSARQKHRPSRQARCVNGCGNPFFLFRVLRILSRSALRMTDIQLLQAPQGVQIYFRLNKILPFIIALSGILP